MANRRRNAIFHRLSRLRGLPADEKMLLQRIGNLLDTALNNRQASNPYEPSKNNPNRLLYPPTGLVAHTGFQTLKLTWLAPKSDIHLRYDVVITNTETGVSETKSTYTNELRYKNVNGSYRAKVKSVGRNGSSSTIETIEFVLGGSVMQIEGSKNGPTEVGTIVQDHITIYDGYSVYVWGSVVLDKFIAGTSNEPAVFQLWSMEGANQTFDSGVATLQQTVTMYPASETFSNLDDNARGGLIERPIAPRTGSFETSQSVMFSPISITADAETTVTFFLLALGRVAEQDEVNLSLVLWGGFDGLGDNVPQDPWDGGRSDFVFPHLNSLRLWRRVLDENDLYGATLEGSWYLAEQPKEFNLIDNAWTIACWFRLETKHVNLMHGGALGGYYASGNTIFARSSYKGPGTDENWKENSIEISLSGVIVGGVAGTTRRQIVNVVVYDADGDGSDILIADFDTQTFGETHNPPVEDNDDDGYAFGGTNWQAPNYEWVFIVVCYEGGPEGATGSPTQGTDLTPKIRVYTNDRPALDLDPDQRWTTTDGMCHMNQRVADGAFSTRQSNPHLLLKELNQDITNDYIYSIGHHSPTQMFNHGRYIGDHVAVQNGTFFIHQMGMWNVAIDNWDGMGFNPGNAEQRDSSPSYTNPFTWGGRWFDPPRVNYTTGRQNLTAGSSLTAIHYLYNSMYGTDINWLKNSNPRIDGAVEYPFAENLIHLWQFGAIAEEFSTTSEALRDTGNYMYGGDVNFLRALTVPMYDGATNSNGWSKYCELSDIISPVRSNWADYYEGADPAIRALLPPLEYASETLPNWLDQDGIIQPEGHKNGAGYPDAGTTAHHLAYPGWGPVTLENAAGPNYSGAAGPQGAGISVGWRRPRTTNGVLDEPKAWGCAAPTTTLQYGELTLWGFDNWIQYPDRYPEDYPDGWS
jgi:hypothetical protein